jgi:hypothetical protein
MELGALELGALELGALELGAVGLGAVGLGGACGAAVALDPGAGTVGVWARSARAMSAAEATEISMQQARAMRRRYIGSP